MTRTLKRWLGVIIASVLSVPVGWSQEPSTEELRKEIRALSETVKSMQKDLQEIKNLLLSRAPATPPQNVVLDLDKAPARGKNNAKLTLVEFSDYQ